jgi:hypothetical protein
MRYSILDLVFFFPFVKHLDFVGVNYEGCELPTRKIKIPVHTFPVTVTDCDFHELHHPILQIFRCWKDAGSPTFMQCGGIPAVMFT